MLTLNWRASRQARLRTWTGGTRRSDGGPKRSTVHDCINRKNVLCICNSVISNLSDPIHHQFYCYNQCCARQEIKHPSQSASPHTNPPQRDRAEVFIGFVIPSAVVGCL